jgi:hypothetical protein
LPIQGQLKEPRRNDVPFDKDLAKHFLSRGIQIPSHTRLQKISRCQVVGFAWLRGVKTIKNTLMEIGSQGENYAQFDGPNIEYSVPLSAPWKAISRLQI